MAKSRAKKPRLGRGLSSLMSTAVPVSPPKQEDAKAPADQDEQANQAKQGDDIVTPPEQTAHVAEPVTPAVVPIECEPPAKQPPAKQPSESKAPATASKAPTKAAAAPEPDVSRETATPSQPAKPSQSATPADTSSGKPADVEPQDDLDEGDEPVGLTWISLGSIVSNPYQPRRTFDKEALEHLADSIRQDGVMQPIVVRPGSKRGTYQLVAGERRWRAATKADLEQIPAVVRELTDQQMAEWAVIENLQREDLDPIERAQAFNRLANQFSMSHEDIAGRVGANRSTITNLMRLLDLHEDIQAMIKAGAISAGHGRCLLALSDNEAQMIMAKRAVAGGWSVRMTEAAVRRAVNTDETPSERKKATRSAHFGDLEKQIASQLGTKVHLKSGRKKNSGTLAIEYYNIEQFDDLLEKLGVNID